MLFSYDGGLNIYNSQTIKHNSMHLLMDLQSHRERDNARCPIIFIAHSVGGLLVKQAIAAADYQPNWKNLYQDIMGIMFIGTPHLGSDLAGWVGIYARLARMISPKINSHVLHSLKSTPEILSIIDQDFFVILRKKSSTTEPIEIVTFYEELGLPNVGIIVPRHSAVLPAYPTSSLHANHVEMASFDSPDDYGYQQISHELKRLLHKLKEPFTQYPAPTEQQAPITVYQLLKEGGPSNLVEDLQRQLLETTRLSYGEKDPRSLWEKKRTADVYFARGLWRDAEILLRDTLQVCSEMENTFLHNSTKNSLALILLEKGMVTEAEQLTILPSSKVPETEDEIISLDILAAIHFRQARYGESLQERSLLVRISRERFGRLDPKTLQENSVLALTSAEGRLQPELLKEAAYEEINTANAFADFYGKRHPITLKQSSIVALIFMKLYMYMRSLEYLTKAITLAEGGAYSLREVLGPDHPYSLHAMHNLAVALAANDREEEAEGISLRVTQGLTRALPIEHPMASASRELSALLQNHTVQRSYALHLAFDWGGSAPWLTNLILLHLIPRIFHLL